MEIKNKLDNLLKEVGLSSYEELAMVARREAEVESAITFGYEPYGPQDPKPKLRKGGIWVIFFEDHAHILTPGFEPFRYVYEGNSGVTNILKLIDHHA